MKENVKNVVELGESTEQKNKLEKRSLPQSWNSDLFGEGVFAACGMVVKLSRLPRVSLSMIPRPGLADRKLQAGTGTR